MKKLILFIPLSILIFSKSYSQVSFEKGYFIDESDQRIECFIKNKDWKNNPTEFKYKIDPNGEAQTATIVKVKEFGIVGFSKYVRATVDIDRSSDKPDQLSVDRNPNFQKEQLFLNTVIEGKASLFFYFEGQLVRFFYQVNGSNIKQLVYKPYLVTFEGNSATASGSFKPTVRFAKYNNHFRQQILLDLACQNISEKDLAHINYDRASLRRIFIRYNKCTSSNYTDLAAKKNLFHLTLRPTLNNSSLVVKNSSLDALSVDFGKNTSFQLGIEAEVVLPFNKNKWSLIVEPTYQRFKSEKSKQSSQVAGGIIFSKVNYESFELPVGVRHYFFLNKQSAIFANVSFCANFPRNSSIQYFRDNGSNLGVDYAIQAPQRNLTFGIGYKFKDRYRFELRYNNRDLLIPSGLQRDVNASYSSLNLSAGFTLF
jgi:hypothetical protein